MNAIILALVLINPRPMTWTDYGRLRVGMPAAFASSVLAPNEPKEGVTADGNLTRVYNDGEKLIILKIRDDRVVSKEWFQPK